MSFIAIFESVRKDENKKKKKKKTKNVSQYLKARISGTPKAIQLGFGVWSTEGGGRLCSKIRIVSFRQHGATNA